MTYQNNGRSRTSRALLNDTANRTLNVSVRYATAFFAKNVFVEPGSAITLISHPT